MLLLQLINRIRQGLLVGLDVAPDVAVALVAGGFAGVVDAFLLGELAQEGMAQHVGRDVERLMPGRVMTSQDSGYRWPLC